MNIRKWCLFNVLCLVNSEVTLDFSALTMFLGLLTLEEAELNTEQGSYYSSIEKFPNLII